MWQNRESVCPHSLPSGSWTFTASLLSSVRLEVKVLPRVSSRERRSLSRMLESSAGVGGGQCAPVPSFSMENRPTVQQLPEAPSLASCSQTPGCTTLVDTCCLVCRETHHLLRSSCLCLSFSRNGGKGRRPKMAAETRHSFLIEEEWLAQILSHVGSAC